MYSGKVSQTAAKVLWPCAKERARNETETCGSKGFFGR